MKMPGAQTGTYQRSLNRIVLSNRADLKAIGPGDELPNQRVKAVRELLWGQRFFITTTQAIKLLSLHGLMVWTKYTIARRAKIRKMRVANESKN
jgi:hypothetical protein